MVSSFLQFGLLLGLAAVFSLIARLVKQPPIIAYLFAGIIAGPLFFNVLPAEDTLHLFARLGVAFLLFIVGLNLNFKSLRSVGGVSVISGVGTLALVAGLCFFLAQFFGYSLQTSLYLAAAFSFSSTVVVVKLLTDKKEIDTLHGRIALGILIIEDFIAALLLMVVPVIGDATSGVIMLQLLKALGLIVAVFIVGLYVLPFIFSYAARWSETLFLASTAWLLLIGSLFAHLGFSIEIGALLAGMTLASSRYAFDISSRMKGLRDFFMVLFFVYFGSLLTGPFTAHLWGAAIGFSLLILLGKPLIVMAFMRLFGYRKRTNFFAGIGLAQISEFSLVLLLLGFTQGIIGQPVLTLGLVVAFITLAISSYSLTYSHILFKALAPLLSIFEGKSFDVDDLRVSKKYDIILFGYNRIGFSLVKAFNHAHKSYLVVDYNPQTILDLTKRGITCVYGDARDSELLEELRLNEASMVISTIPDFDINLAIGNSIHSNHTLFIPTSHSFEQTNELYQKGADYVIMPHFLGGSYVADLLMRENFSRSALNEEGKKQQRDMKERVKEGQTHPTKDHYGR